MSKKLHIKTYGCQMNVYDSDRMQDLMLACGYQLTDTPDGADMVIINTCHKTRGQTNDLSSRIGLIARHVLENIIDGRKRWFWRDTHKLIPKTGGIPSGGCCVYDVGGTDIIVSN